MASKLSIGFILIFIISSMINYPFKVKCISQDVEILNYTHYTLSGYYYIIGEVKNIGEKPLEKIKITATFYDNKNNVLATTFGFTTLTILMSQQKSPFKISSEPYLNLQVDHYTLSITEEKESNYYPYNQLKIEGTTWNVEQGYQVLFGDVKNIGDRIATSVNVIATFYDSNGKILSTNYAFTTPENINVGETVRFKVSTAPLSIITFNWTIQIQCHETLMASQLTCSPKKDYIVFGETIPVIGSLTPILTGESINLIYTKPNGVKIEKTVLTSLIGSYTDNIIPDILGNWRVKATWQGNSLIYGANSTEASFVVLSKAPSNITIESYQTSSYMNENRIFTGTLTPKIDGADITLIFEKPDGKQTKLTNKTDTNSKYYLETNIFDYIGTWKVKATWDGNALFQGTNSSTLQFNITEPPTKGNVKLIVQDNSGYLLPGAVVISTQEPAGQGKIGGITNAEGIVELNQILAGVYNFKITIFGYTESSIIINLVRGEATSKTITLNALSSTLKIQVKTSDNQLLTNVNILSTVYPEEQTQLSGSTDSNGIIIFTNMKRGNYTIKASKTGYEDKLTIINLGLAETLDKVIILNPIPKTDIGIPAYPLNSIFIGIILFTLTLILFNKKVNIQIIKT